VENAVKRSPLRARALRNPGESVDVARRRHQMEVMGLPVAITCAALAAAVIETIGHFFNVPRRPFFYLALLAVAALYLAWRVWRVRPILRALKLAGEGEKAVGQFLEKLRHDGYEVLHDVPGGNFNIDHVLIGPGGVFTIETKTWNKPATSDPRITFDGEALLASGIQLDRDPIRQARGQVSWIRTLLKESTGQDYPVRGVVLFPGWYVEQAPEALRELWVLNPKALPAFLSHSRASLTQERVKLAAFHLSRYVRGVAEETL
jgi:hypothetical protein